LTTTGTRGGAFEGRGIHAKRGIPAGRDIRGGRNIRHARRGVHERTRPVSYVNIYLAWSDIVEDSMFGFADTHSARIVPGADPCPPFHAR